jgi:hypothetical protein
MPEPLKQGLATLLAPRATLDTKKISTSDAIDQVMLLIRPKKGWYDSANTVNKEVTISYC